MIVIVNLIAQCIAMGDTIVFLLFLMSEYVKGNYMNNKDVEMMSSIRECLEELRKEGLLYILVSGTKNKVKLETVNEIPNKFQGIALKSDEATVFTLNYAINEARGI